MLTSLDFTDQPWVFASTNQSKLAELRAAFAETSIVLKSLVESGDAPAWEESGATIRENAIIKAEAIARHFRCLTLADDTGLFVRALGGDPGVRTARYAGLSASAESNRKKLLEALSGVPIEERQAEFRCVLILADEQGSIVAEAQGSCPGMILESPRGESRFPYDPLFWIPAQQATLCQLNEKTRSQINHRSVAAKRLIETLISDLKSDDSKN